MHGWNGMVNKNNNKAEAEKKGKEGKFNLFICRVVVVASNKLWLIECRLSVYARVGREHFCCL